MWMVDCNNDHGKESKIFSDPIFARRLRPLMPRPLISSNNTSSATFSCTLTTPSCFCGTSKPNTLLPWNHTMMSGVMSDTYGIRREMNGAMPMVSTRWNPTPEQLQALEEMYKRGTRTPTAEQIQQIASKLRRFGKIEGKNVFYWFQNHKARERQKIKRRQLELLGGKKSTRNAEENTKETAGLSSARCNDFEHQNKSLPTLSTCCNKSYTKATVSMHGSVMTERENKDEWTQLDQKELHQNQKIDGDNYNNDNKVTAKSVNNYCLKLDLSSSFQPANKNTFTAAAAAAHEKKASSGQHQNCSKLFGSMLILSPMNDGSIINVEEDTDQTLQLFPVGSSGLNSVELCDHVSDMRRKFASAEFIEFLPTKN